MDKTCIINPATGRAVKIDSRLGKKLNKEDGAVKKLQAVVKRAVYKKPVTENQIKTIEIKEKPKRKKKEPTKVVKEPSKKDKEDASKKLQAVVKRKLSKKPNPEPTPMASGGVKKNTTLII